MEMYTNDLIDLVDVYAAKEKAYRAKNGDYAVKDLLCDFQTETRRILHERLVESFISLVESCKQINEPIELDDLTRIINEL